uniref:glycerophosphodiester phosphodiesterase n=1 Tax=Desulforadius tongensis TaxID=1216062 RepID=UPI0030840B2B
MKRFYRYVILSLVLLLVAFSAVGCGNTAEKEKQPQAEVGEKIVIGHRGACGYLPEHTLESYALAYAMGADYIEPDVVMTKDGVPVVMHDIHLDANTNVAEVFPDRKRSDGRYYVIDFTLDEIKSLRVNERVNVDTKEAVYPGRFPVGDSKFEVPTLEEMIQLVQGLNKSTGRDVGIYPELKEPKFHLENGIDMGPIVLDLLAKYGYDGPEDKIYLQCFDPDYLKRVRNEMGAKIKLVQLIDEGDIYEKMMTPEGLDEVAKYADGIGPWYMQIRDAKGKTDEYPVINPNLVADAHQRGLVVHPYTFRKDQLPEYVDSVEELMKLFYYDIGVDGVFTDFPDLGVKVVQEGPDKK